MADFDAFYRACGGRAAADDLPALDRRLPRGVRAAGRAGLRRRVDPHLGRHLGTVESARQARSSRRADGADRVTVIDSESACGGLGLVALAAARAAEPGAERRGGRRAGARARAELKMWFAVDTLEYLRRGGRIGAASAWLGIGAQDQADPDAGARRSRRSSACARGDGRMRAARRVRRAAPGTTARTAGSCSTSRLPRRPSGWWRRPRSSWASRRCSCRRSGPVIGAHVGPGLLGVGGVLHASHLRVARPSARAA